MKKVSIITPSFSRAPFLELCYQCFISQTYPNLEWLVLDDSPEPCDFFFQIVDENVHYIHSAKRISIGEKRNQLIAQANGEIIVHFDDDDFYAPHYVAHMVSEMEQQQADFINNRGFFLYDASFERLCYWLLEKKSGAHFRIKKEHVEAVVLDAKTFEHNHLGYGFGYVYKKQLWQDHPFADMNWNEDSTFTMKALNSGAILGGTEDTKGLCLHFLHRNSTSICFPQYLIPSALIGSWFSLDMIRKYIVANL